MPITADRPEASTTIRTDLGAIFVSLELSRSTWLISSLSPGGRDKMSKHSVRGGDVPELLSRFKLLQKKTQARTGKLFPIVAIQEAGLDGFWIHRALEANDVESHVVDPASIAVRRPYVSLNRRWKQAVSCNLAQTMDTETTERRDFAMYQ